MLCDVTCSFPLSSPYWTVCYQKCSHPLSANVLNINYHIKTKKLNLYQNHPVMCELSIRHLLLPARSCVYIMFLKICIFVDIYKVSVRIKNCFVWQDFEYFFPSMWEVHLFSFGILTALSPRSPFHVLSGKKSTSGCNFKRSLKFHK